MMQGKLSAKKKAVDFASLWQIGATGLVGARPSMEDEHAIDEWMFENGTPCLLTGVFDGHNGNQCSKFISTALPKAIKENLEGISDLSDVLHQAFIDTDK